MIKRLIVTAAVVLGLLGFTNPAGAIINGSAVPQGKYPWMAVVKQNGAFICGGTVISSQWVLTAAHCIMDGTYTVTLGTINRSNGTGQTLSVDQKIVHPSYDSAAVTNDAALLHLTTATLQPAITLAGAGDEDLEADGRAVTVAGWGDITPTLGLLSSSTLREVGLNVVNDQNCFGETSSVAAVTEVCAEALLKDSCNGDSGGPLFAPKSGRYVQIGIVSHGFSCAIPMFPGSYSEVNATSIRGWITTTTGV